MKLSEKVRESPSSYGPVAAFRLLHRRNGVFPERVLPAEVFPRLLRLGRNLRRLQAFLGKKEASGHRLRAGIDNVAYYTA